MLKYLAKISMDIFPSVLATIIGAYIVNHYINAKPAPDTPAAAVAAPAGAKKDPNKSTEVANLPPPGVKARGISEKAVSEKAASDKAALEKPASEKPTAEKSVEGKSAETAPAEPANSRVHQPASREKAVAKVTVEANQAPATGAAPAMPDANDLARAAIERLRKSPQETARAPEGPRVQETPQVATGTPFPVRPLPPPITVSTPPSENYGTPPASPPYTASVDSDDPNRPTPPADIPVPVVAPPLDLRADAGPPVPRAKANVADQMLSGVKSMFNAVLPKGVTPD